MANAEAKNVEYFLAMCHICFQSCFKDEGQSCKNIKKNRKHINKLGDKEEQL